MTRVPLPTEREIQKRVVATYEAVGCLVANLAQGYRPGGRRHGTTRQTKGIPDLYVFPPRRLAFRVDGNVDPFWHEVKRPGGEQSPEQRRWQEECQNRSVAYVLGGVDEAVAHLQKLGLIGAGGEGAAGGAEGSSTRWPCRASCAPPARRSLNEREQRGPCVPFSVLGTVLDAAQRWSERPIGGGMGHNIAVEDNARTLSAIQQIKRRLADTGWGPPTREAQGEVEK